MLTTNDMIKHQDERRNEAICEAMADWVAANDDVARRLLSDIFNAVDNHKDVDLSVVAGVLRDAADLIEVPLRLEIKLDADQR